MEEIQDTWLGVALKMTSISLKNTVMDFGKAYENPIEMKAPNTTAQPHPPSGGVYPTGPPTAGGMAAHKWVEDEAGERDRVEFVFWRTAGLQRTLQGVAGWRSALKIGPVGETKQRACKNPQTNTQRLDNEDWVKMTAGTPPVSSFFRTTKLLPVHF